MEAIVVFAVIFFVIQSLLTASKKQQPQARRMQQAQVRFPEPVPDAPAPSPAAANGLTPEMQPTITPTLHDHQDTYTGSMGDLFVEGFDPHDHGQAEVDVPSMHSDSELNDSLLAVEELEENAAPLLNWSGNAIVQAFVMQEVLKRPCERAR